MVFTTIVFGLFFGFYGLVLLRAAWPQPALPPLAHLPRVSILVAARNEEATIERCLRALAALHYPAEQLEILIGDDASTDDTAAVVQRFIADKPQFRLLPIRHRLGTTRGKSNVLAHLCRAATTDYFPLTDADMALHPEWVAAMLAATPEGVGVVTGITTAGGGLFGRMQGLDWLFGLNLIRLLTDCGLPVTAVGNNMLVTRGAYESIGGYEALAFSVTEDLQLFTQIVAQGWHYRNLIEPRVLGISVPQPTLRPLHPAQALDEGGRPPALAAGGAVQLLWRFLHDGGLAGVAAPRYHRGVAGSQNAVPKPVSTYHIAAGRAPRAPGRAAALRGLPAGYVAGSAGLHRVARRHSVEGAPLPLGRRVGE
jgi:hypothetical protein